MSRAKYQQIAAQIAAQIDAGNYAKGSKLPAHRTLAHELKTTAVTIAKAYQLLVEQRKVESFVGRGSFVRDDRLQRAIGADNQTLNFSILQPCIDHNFTELQQAFNQVIASGDQRNFGYLERSGSDEHRLAAAKWSSYYGLNSNSRQMLLTSGAQQALSALISRYTAPGDVIAVEEHTYPGLLAAIRYLKREAVAVAIDSQGMQADALEDCCMQRAPKMVVVVPAHQNPTGATMGNVRRSALAAVVDKYKLWLVEDDIYAFLNTQPIAAITNYAPERSFHISSLSKALSPGMRCGFLSVPPSQLQTMADFMRAMHWMPAALPFAAASELIYSERAFSMARQQRDLANKRQQQLAVALAGFNFAGQHSSYSSWLRLPKQWKGDSFSAAALAQGVSVSDGAFFSLSQSRSDHVRLSVMGSGDEGCYAKGLTIIASLLKLSGEEPWQC